MLQLAHPKVTHPKLGAFRPQVILKGNKESLYNWAVTPAGHTEEKGVKENITLSGGTFYMHFSCKILFFFFSYPTKKLPPQLGLLNTPTAFMQRSKTPHRHQRMSSIWH